LQSKLTSPAAAARAPPWLGRAHKKNPLFFWGPFFKNIENCQIIIRAISKRPLKAAEFCHGFSEHAEFQFFDAQTQCSVSRSAAAVLAVWQNSKCATLCTLYEKIEC
jgi:hypothetical protein